MCFTIALEKCCYYHEGPVGHQKHSVICMAAVLRLFYRKIKMDNKAKTKVVSVTEKENSSTHRI